MAEWRFDSGPPPPQPQQVQEAPRPSPVGAPLGVLVCDHCGNVIKPGEAAIEIIPGKVGFGERSGRPMIVDDDQSQYPQANLHPHCVYGFVHDLDESMENLPETVDLVCEGCGITIGEFTGYKSGDVYCSHCADRLRG